MKEKGLSVLLHDYTNVVPHIYIVKLPNNINRDDIREYLNDYGVQTGVHYQPNHWLTFYMEEGVKVKHVDSIYPYLLSLPLHPELSIKDVEYVCRILMDAIND